MSKLKFQTRSVVPSFRLFVGMLSIFSVLLVASPPVSAKQTVLTVKSGWDVSDPGATGYVIYSVTSSQRACKPKLQITYILQRAKPSQTYALSIGIYNQPGDGVKSFGVPRFQHATFNPEGVEAIQDSFIVGSFTTDPSGNGESHIELDLTGVPGGTYDAHFVWTRLTDTRAFYRTGIKYGVGFAKIIVP